MFRLMVLLLLCGTAEADVRWFLMGSHVSEPGVTWDDIENDFLGAGLTWRRGRVEVDLALGKNRLGCHASHPRCARWLPAGSVTVRWYLR